MKSVLTAATVSLLALGLLAAPAAAFSVTFSLPNLTYPDGAVSPSTKSAPPLVAPVLK